MEAGQEETDPGAEDLAEHAGADHREPEQAGPGARALYAVLGEQDQSAVGALDEEVAGHLQHHPRLDQPALPARPVARREQPGVEGDALMLDLLDRMPAPQSRRLGIGALQMARIAEQLMGDHGGEMLERHGRGEVDDRRAGLGLLEPLVDSFLERSDVVAGLDRALVEGDMLAAVHHLLGGEGADLLGEPWRRSVAEGADALDEKGLALGKGDRKRVVERAAIGVAGQPPSIGALAAAEATVAWRDGQIGGCYLAPHADISFPR